MEAPPQSATSTDDLGQPLQLLVQSGLMLARERNVEAIVQTALDTGRELCGAQWGAFFYSTLAADGARCPLFKLSGSAASNRSNFPLRDVDHRLIETLFHHGLLRCADISADEHFGPESPFAALTTGPQATRSYFAVPVMTAEGEVLGGMLYGHTRPDVFHAGCDSMVQTIAAQAAIAIENTHLHDRLSQQVEEASKARQAQRETADRLAQVFEATNDAVFLCDREWRITYMNHRAIDIASLGESLTGQILWEAFPEAVSSTFHQKYTQVMAGQGPREFVEFYPPLNLWLNVKAFPTAEGIAVFYQDITEERRIQRQKSDADRRLRQALDAAQLGTWSWDRNTDLLDLDERAAQLFFFEPHVAVSRSEVRNRIVFEDDRDIITANLRKAMDTGGLYHAEYRVVSPDGVQIWLSASGMPTFSDEDEINGMVGTLQDVTLRKTQETALRQSEKLAATGRLAATIAHEINNPLEAVTNLIYLVKTDPTISPPLLQLLETADEELARVAQIAQQTLGFYRDTTRPVDIDLSQLLRSVMALFERKLSYKQILFNFDFAPNLHVFGLQGELRQVFSNLIVNAIDASTEGSITVRARHCTVGGVPGVSVLVSDRGSGIPPSVRGRMFSPFFTTKLSVGTGLGLWVTRGIVEKQGGSIRFRSRSTPPTGTVFRVFLRARMQSH